jgi:lycopene beta-cyclase
MTTTVRTLFNRMSQVQISAADRAQYGLIVAWVLAMIALPILVWTFGESVLPIAVTGALLVQCAAVLYSLSRTLPWRQLVTLFGVILLVTWAFEFVGSRYDIPFGAYDYTERLQPKIAGVPLLVPLAWFMMLPSSWVVASLIVPKGHVWTNAAFVLISATAMTAWDLFLDPQMVGWGFWIWDSPAQYGPVYFSIPFVNFAGWMLTASVATALVRPWRFRLNAAPLLVIYGVTWFLETVGLAVFWGQPGPALFGSSVLM